MKLKYKRVKGKLILKEEFDMGKKKETLSKWLVKKRYPLTVIQMASLTGKKRIDIYNQYDKDRAVVDQWREETQEMWESILPKGTK